MNRQVTLKPKDWPGFHGWEVLAGATEYLGLIGEYGTDGYKPYFRAYGVGDLDGHRVAVEHTFMSRDEAVAWLLNGGAA